MTRRLAADQVDRWESRRKERKGKKSSLEISCRVYSVFQIRNNQLRNLIRQVPSYYSAIIHLVATLLFVIVLIAISLVNATSCATEESLYSYLADRRGLLMTYVHRKEWLAYNLPFSHNEVRPLSLLNIFFIRIKVKTATLALNSFLNLTETPYANYIADRHAHV